MKRIHEIFYSLQGEGFHTGTAAVFVRFSGCNLRCPFCDTDFGGYREMRDEEIVAECGRFPSKFVVLTGGEPSLQIDVPFIALLKLHGYYVAVETNGTRPLPEGIDWVACSPKDAPLKLSHADELKVVYQGGNVDGWISEAQKLGAKHLFVQPCSCSNIEATVDFVKSHPSWRLSLQTHKLIGIE